MTEITLSNNLIDTDEEIEIEKRKKKQEYFYNYFKEHSHRMHVCPHCGKVRKCSDNIARHEKSKKCMKARGLI